MIFHRRAEVTSETFAVAHPSGWRRHLPFTGSWVTTGLRRDFRAPLDIHVEEEALTLRPQCASQMSHLEVGRGLLHIICMAINCSGVTYRAEVVIMCTRKRFRWYEMHQ